MFTINRLNKTDVGQKCNKRDKNKELERCSSVAAVSSFADCRLVSYYSAATMAVKGDWWMEWQAGCWKRSQSDAGEWSTARQQGARLVLLDHCWPVHRRRCCQQN